MTESLTKKTFKAFFWQFGGTIFKMVAQLAVLFILARLIPKADFGIVSSALIVVGLAKLVSQMGVGPALVQKNNLTTLHIRAGATLTFIFSLVLFATVFFSSGLIATFFRMPELVKVMKVVSTLFILEGITTVSWSLLLRDMRQKTLVIIDFISYSIGYGLVALTLAYFGYGLWALIGGQLMQSLLQCILTYLWSRHSLLPYWGIPEIKELLYYGGGFTLAKLFNYTALQGDNAITGRYLGDTALGLYSRAYAIMVQPVSLIGSSIDRALFPAMAARQNQKDKLIEAFIHGAQMIHFACIPISFIIIFTADEIINVALGPGWEEAIIPLQILTAGLIFRMGYKMGDSLARATGKVYNRAKRTFIYAIVMIIGCYIGTFWGINGVAVGTLIAVTVNYILMIHLSLTILDISWLYYLKRSFAELKIAILLSIIFVGVIFGAKTVFSVKVIVLLTSYGASAIIASILFYRYSYKLSFIKILPFKEVLNKFTKLKS